MQPSAPVLSSAPPLSLDDYRMQKLSALAMQHEIRADWIARLRGLEGFTIVVRVEPDALYPATALHSSSLSAFPPSHPSHSFYWTTLAA